MHRIYQGVQYFRSSCIILLILQIMGCGTRHEQASDNGTLYRIDILPSSLQIEVGEDITFKTSGIDKEGRPISINPIWSCNSNGTINPTQGQTVIFTALNEGSCTILATEGKIQTSTTIGIIPRQLHSIKIIPAQVGATAGQEVVLTAEGRDKRNKPFPVTPVWSATEGATLNPKAGTNSVFKTDKTGTYYITATQGNISGNGIVRVNPSLVSDILKNIYIMADRAELSVGEELTLVAEGKDVKGESMEINPIWAATSEGSLTPDTGKSVSFTAVSPGRCTVTAEQDGIRSFLHINISPMALANLWIESGYTVIGVGESIELTANGTDTAGNEVSINPVWSCTEQGEVSPDTGKTISFKAISTGRCTVSAEQDGVSTSINIDITPGALAELWIEPEYAELQIGRSTTLTAKGADSEGNEVEVDPTWKADPLGNLDAKTGRIVSFKGLIAGECRISAEIANKAATSIVYIYVPQVPSADYIYIEPDWAELTVGDRITLKAVGVDKHGHPVDINPLWSSSPNGRVDPSSGNRTVFTALHQGVCTVSAVEGDKTVEINIDIKAR